MGARQTLVAITVCATAFAACNSRREKPPAKRATPPATTNDPLLQASWPAVTIDWSAPIPAEAAAPGDGYVGSAPCVGCHEKEGATYKRHAMASSGIRPIAAAPREMLAAFDKNPVVRHERSGLAYRLFRRDGGYFVEEYLDGPDGLRLHSWTQPITHTFTSGVFGVALLFDKGDFYIQIPLDWYSQSKRFALDPGFGNNNDRFRIALSTSCMSCHGDYPRHRAGSEDMWIDPPPTGIGCERCHGPGAKHAETLAPEDVVNPARLSPRRQLDICAQCHLEGIAEILRAGRDHFSYRPGEPLDSYRQVFVEQEADLDAFRITDHTERLARSACFTRSAGKMTCTTCHDPHTSSLAETRATWRKGCLSCHQESACTAPAADRKANGDDCAACHMRRDTPYDFRKNVKNVPLPISDHWIRTRPSPPVPLDVPMRLHASGKLVTFGTLLGEQEEGPDVRAVYGAAMLMLGQRDEGTAALIDGLPTGPVRRGLELLSEDYCDAWSTRARTAQMRAQAADGCRRLRAMVVQQHPDDPEVLAAYAQAIFDSGGAGDDSEAAKAIERALRIAPTHPHALEMQGRALLATGKRAEARAVLETSVEAGPYQLPSWVMLGIIARDDGRLADAAYAFEQALLRSPLDRWLLRQLDSVYTKLGDTAKREALAKVSATTAGTSTGQSPSTKGLPGDIL